MVPRIVVSGGQTGADRAAFDAAIECGLRIGGWVPKGRRAEDGDVPKKYSNLRETDSSHYEDRTRKNVHDADATLIITHGELHAGSRFTRDMAVNMRKPYLHVDLNALSRDEALAEIHAWLRSVKGEVLNVAGPRESSDPKIYDAAREIMTAILKDRPED